jgi:uncharacterized protein (TIGR00251 family)
VARKQFNLHDGKKGAALAIRVTPRARRNEIVEVLSDGTVKIRITAQPDEEQSNQALINFLSEVLKVPTSRIEIVAGITGRDKLVSILDLDADAVHHTILSHLI